MRRIQTPVPAGQRPTTPTSIVPPGPVGDGAPGRPGPRGGRLVRLTTSCPRCGSRPALRVTEDLVRGINAPGESTRIGTYQCHRRGCGTIYDIYVNDRLLETELGGSV